MTLDWTVHVWPLLMICVWLLAGRRALHDVRARLTRIEARIDRVERML